MVSPVNVHDDDFGKLRYTCTCSSFIHLVGGVKYLAYNIKDFSLCFRYMQWRKQRGRMHSLKWYAGDRPTGWELHQAKKGEKWDEMRNSGEPESCQWKIGQNSTITHTSACVDFGIFFRERASLSPPLPPSIFSVPK